MKRHVKPISEIIGKVLLLMVMAFAILFTVMIIAGIILTVVHLRREGGITDIDTGSFQVPWLDKFVQPVCFIAAPFLMYLSFERRRGWAMGLKMPLALAGRRLGEGMGWGILLMGISFAGIGLAGGYRILDWGVRSGEWAEIGIWFVLFVFVAVNEELLTRGYVQGLIRHHYGPWPAIIVTSLIFSSMHLANDNILQNPIPLLELFLAGILLGIAREASGSLWAPIGLHLTWNFFQGNVFGFAVSGNPVEAFVRLEPRGAEWLSGGGFGAEGSLITLLITAAGCWAVHRWYAGRSAAIRKAPPASTF